MTGAAISPDGQHLVLRTYTDAYLWDLTAGDVVGALRTGRRTRIPLPATAQGEGVTFTPDSQSLITSTERLPAPVYLVPLPISVATSSAAPTTPPSSAPSTGRTTAADAEQTPAAAPSPLARAASGGTSSTLRNVLIAVVVAGGVLWAASRLRRDRRRPG